MINNGLLFYSCTNTLVLTRRDWDEGVTGNYCHPLRAEARGGLLKVTPSCELRNTKVDGSRGGGALGPEPEPAALGSLNFPGQNTRLPSVPRNTSGSRADRTDRTPSGRGGRY